MTLSPLVSATIKEKLAAKRLIFTVTTGRSGTNYLSYLLGLIKGIDSFHEPEPGFQLVIHKVQDQPELAKNFWLEQKLPSIVSHSQPIYVETSHATCKGFIEPLLDLGLLPDLILLSRSHRAVARSFYRLDTIPGRSVPGLIWCLSPGDSSVYLPLENWESLHDYQLCFWYCLEIERRQKHYGRLLSEKGARVSAITIPELVKGDGLSKLIRELGLPRLSLWGWMLYWLKRNRPRNTQSKKKQRLSKPPLTEGELEALEQELFDKLGEQA